MQLQNQTYFMELSMKNNFKTSYIFTQFKYLHLSANEITAVELCQNTKKKKKKKILRYPIARNVACEVQFNKVTYNSTQIVGKLGSVWANDSPRGPVYYGERYTQQARDKSYLLAIT